MKSIFKFGWVVLFSFAISMLSPAQTPQNMVAGTGPLTNSIAAVSGVSVVNLISGNTLFPTNAKQSVLYVGFTAGGSANVTMVLYRTKRNNFEIEEVIPVTFGGGGSATIPLDISNCRVVPPTTVTPCVIRLDPLNFKLSPLNDYYFVMYFNPNDPVNFAVDGAVSLNSNTTIIGGLDAKDDTTLVKGDVIPSTFLNKGRASFLVGVMNN